jgi:L-alanine-DL-glutamate epimerase-like enolase superfamily enzyme
MKITAIETIHVGAYPNITFVEIHTDDGLSGLGETFRGPQAVAAHVHESIAPYLLGRDPCEVEAHSRQMLGGYLGFASSGAETRAGSAVDIALWDLWGKATNQSVLQLLGGAVRDKIRVYNTCAGYTYNSRGGRRLISADSSEQSAEGPYEDQIAFMKRPAELAHSLLEMGISAMKIWPFDPLAEATGGQSIARGDLAKGVAPFKAIRDALGDRMDIMCELHSIWSVPAALEIAAALRDVGIYWAEDPIKMVNAQALADYRRQAGIRVCASETLATRYGFRELLEKDAVDYVMIDLSWCGGLTESKKIATQAETFQRPIAPHDCTGPVVLIASLALALNAPNAIFQEVVRAYYTGWYTELVTTLPRIDQGFAYPMAGPGLGTALLPGLKARADVSVRRSELQ